MVETIYQQLFAVLLLSFYSYPPITAGNSGCIPAHSDPGALKQCGGKGYTLQCNSTNHTKVPSSFPPPTGDLTPPLCVLNLNDNQIQRIENNSFIQVFDVQYLYLSDNNITYIESDAFYNLSQLKYLNLSGNGLAWPDSFGKYVFGPLVNLTVINLKENKIETFRGLDEAMRPLLKLEGIFIDGCSNCSFGPGFANFAKLRNISLSGRSNHDCNIGTVSRETVRNLPQISRLWMANCHITNIEPTSFEKLKQLKHLDFSYNEDLHFDGMNNALCGLKHHTSLEELNVNRIHPLYDVGIVLEESHIECLKTLRNLTVLHMDLNKIEVIDERILYPEYQLPHTLKVFTLSGNRLTIGSYVQYLTMATNITHLDISRQHFVYDPFVPCHFQPDVCSTPSNGKLSAPECKPILVPPAVTKLYWRKSFMYAPVIPDLCVINGSNLEFMDISFNLLLQWTGNVTGLENLIHIDLSDNACTNMSHTFFHQFPKLEYLNISGNILSRSLDPNNPMHADESFKKLTKLKTLDLSRNHINELPTDIFQKQMSIENIHLNNNDLEVVNFTINTRACLKILDLSNNKLRYLPMSLTMYLDSIVDRGCSAVEVSIFGNPIECSCQTVDFLRWMLKASKVNVAYCTYCYLQDGSRKVFNNAESLGEIVDDLEDSCRDRTPLLVMTVSISTTVCTLVFCSLIYRYRWKLRYLYYNRHRRHAQGGFERLFENDAFVSYAYTMCGFVKNQLVPNLEGIYGLRLWVFDRNSQAGASKTKNIFHAIANSRKAILLIDKAFLKDSMCDYEMNMARMESIESKRPVIVFVLFDGVSLNDLPAGVFKGFTDEEHLKFPTNPNPDNLDEFWKKLFTALAQ